MSPKFWYTRVLDNTKPFLRSSSVCSLVDTGYKERKYHILRQYWLTRNIPVFINTGTFQYLGPQVYFFRIGKGKEEKEERKRERGKKERIKEKGEEEGKGKDQGKGRGRGKRKGMEEEEEEGTIFVLMLD